MSGIDDPRVKARLNAPATHAAVAGLGILQSETANEAAPRVQPGDIEALHRSLVVLTHHFPGTTVTVALAVLPDGFVVGTGQSGCISPEAFDAEIGATIAKGNALAAAREKLWELEGYLLRDRLHAAR